VGRLFPPADEADPIDAAVAVPPPDARPMLPDSGSATAWFSFDTDVSLSGGPAREWLVVSPVGLTVAAAAVNRGEPLPAAPIRQVGWTEIDRVRTAAGIGGGMLQVRERGDWVDLLRYSNARASRFHKLARALETAREAAAGECGSVAEPALQAGSLDPPHCVSCDLRLVTADDACPRCLQKGRILRRVADLVAPHTRGAILLGLLTVVGVAAELVPPKLQQYLVDDILSGRTTAGESGQPDFRTALLVVVLSLAASRVLLSIVAVFKGRLASTIGSGLTSRLRHEMVEKLQGLSVAYYDRHQVSSMISRVAHDSEVLHGLVHQFTGGFLLQIVQLVAVGGMLLWINPKLAAYTLIPVPLVILGSWIFWQYVYPRHYRLWDASSKQMAALSGMLSGIRVVKAFAQEPREQDRFQKASDHLRNWRQWVELTGSTYSAAMQIVFSLGGLIVWYVGGRDVLGHEMTLGQLIAFLAYLAMFYAPLGALSSFTTWLTSFLSGSKRVLELLDTPALIMEPTDPAVWDETRGEIAFRDVTFGYDENQPVLRDVSFSVAPGEMVGIVGRSGSGKSTLVNLLARFHDVQQGAVEIDGIDVRRLPGQQLRERLGIVFQESFLFRGTIWRNLSYGRPQATIDEGLTAAKAAGAHDFICRQPAAYETLLGERGAGLSGGEKQRLSIARTLLADPKILVLDEATSSIDAEAEREIQQALAALVRGRTTIGSSHSTGADSWSRAPMPNCSRPTASTPGSYGSRRRSPVSLRWTRSWWICPRRYQPSSRPWRQSQRSCRPSRRSTGSSQRITDLRPVSTAESSSGLARAGSLPGCLWCRPFRLRTPTPTSPSAAGPTMARNTNSVSCGHSPSGRRPTRKFSRPLLPAERSSARSTASTRRGSTMATSTSRSRPTPVRADSRSAGPRARRSISVPPANS
jgi:ATP-binding cassette subfamily B protein